MMVLPHAPFVRARGDTIGDTSGDIGVVRYVRECEFRERVRVFDNDWSIGVGGKVPNT